MLQMEANLHMEQSSVYNPTDEHQPHITQLHQPSSQSQQLPPSLSQQLPPSHSQHLPPSHSHQLPPSHSQHLPPSHSQHFPPSHSQHLPPSHSQHLLPHHLPSDQVLMFGTVFGTVHALLFKKCVYFVCLLVIQLQEPQTRDSDPEFGRSESVPFLGNPLPPPSPPLNEPVRTLWRIGWRRTKYK